MNPEIQALLDAFTYRPPYYAFHEGEEAPISYIDYGPQNSRGFRALKVWLGLRQVGREGYLRMISDDVELARELPRLAAADPELEARYGRHIPVFAVGTEETELVTTERQVREFLERTLPKTGG